MLNVTNRSGVSDACRRTGLFLLECASFIFTVLALLAVCLLFMPQAQADTMEVEAPVVERLIVTCENTAGMGSQTYLNGPDGPIITAYHVVDGCPGSWVAAWPEYDLALMRAGDPGVCKNAGPGERVIYQGFPDTLEFAPGQTRFNDELETDHGRILMTDQDVSMFDVTRRVTVTQKHATVGTSINVRGGYSGGVALSAEDHRIVGWLVGGGSGRLAYFMPVEAACERINRWNEMDATRTADIDAQTVAAD